MVAVNKYMCFFKMNFWWFGYAEVLSQLHRAETGIDDLLGVNPLKKDFPVLFSVFRDWVLPELASKFNFSSK